MPSGHKKTEAVSRWAEVRSYTPQPSYPWLRLRLSRAQELALLYHSSSQRADVAPDSVYGLAFAMSGTLLLMAMGAGYALRKRWATRAGRDGWAA